MAHVEYWIQIENRRWDASPKNLDRMTGLTIKKVEQHEGQPGNDPVDVTLTSPETGVTRTQRMYKPLRSGVNLADALIVRRYTADWAAPEDRKVNPWDLNEPDPTDSGTMGTIPGAVIECEVGDRVTVHFRNKDFRADKGRPGSLPQPSSPRLRLRTHFRRCLSTLAARPHAARRRGGGSLDRGWRHSGEEGRPCAARRHLHLHLEHLWMADHGWSLAYHDHSVCDMDNVRLGAIGIVVIHNPQDPDDVIDPPLPNNSFVGSPLRTTCRPFPFDLDVLPHDLNRITLAARAPGTSGHGRPGHVGPAPVRPGGHVMSDEAPEADGEQERAVCHGPIDHDAEAPVPERIVQRGDLMLELDEKLTRFRRFCLRTFRKPPDRGLYHDLLGPGMCINGRKYLGNTPTIVAGVNTKCALASSGWATATGFTHSICTATGGSFPAPTGTTRARFRAARRSRPYRSSRTHERSARQTRSSSRSIRARSWARVWSPTRQPWASGTCTAVCSTT